MSLFSSRALKTLRNTMDRFMVDTVEVYEIDDQDETILDPVTLVSSPKPGALIYTGKARIRPTRGPSEMAVGESVIVTRDADISFPWDAPEFRRDNTVKVTASEDPQLVDHWFRLTDVTVSGQKATRSCSALQIQPSRLWGRSA